MPESAESTFVFDRGSDCAASMNFCPSLPRVLVVGPSQFLPLGPLLG
jgi:hypothetical protein